MGRICWQWLIVSYMELGREEQATAEVAKRLEIHPDFSIATTRVIIKRFTYTDASLSDRHTKLLRKAGLPE